MPHRLSLTAMAAEIRARRLSPLELVEAHLRQIEKVNPALNAFVTVLADECRAAARRAESAQQGPLHGVPVTIKDSLDVAGLPTLCGSRFRLGHRADRDSTPAARLRSAGAILIGKTNCPEFLHAYETDNLVTGRTNNPWNAERTPGGSSGGEAAAIAAFCSAGGVGSDGGGSIRVPAHFCGIAGLKPTPGRVPAAGHFPEICHPGGLLGACGPMARTAEDVRALFQVLAGHDNDDPFSAPVALRVPDLTGLRVGVMEQFYQVPVQPAIRMAVQKAARIVESMGTPLSPFEPKGLERAPNLWSSFFDELALPFLRETVRGRESDAHSTTTEFLKAYDGRPDRSAGEVIEWLAARDRMRADLLRQMNEVSVLLMPVASVTAFPHRARRYETGVRQIGMFQAMMTATPWNLLGMPAMVIPFDRDADGLPVGVQLVGKPWEEELLLELAVRIEEARGPFPAAPGV